MKAQLIPKRKKSRNLEHGKHQPNGGSQSSREFFDKMEQKSKRKRQAKNEKLMAKA